MGLKFGSILLTSFFFLGAVSCQMGRESSPSEDEVVSSPSPPPTDGRPSEPVDKKPDPWRLSPPEVFDLKETTNSREGSIETPDEKGRDLLASPGSPIRATAVIVIRSIQEDVKSDLKIGLSIESRCAWLDRTITQTTRVENQALIPLKTILPIEIITSIDPDRSDSVLCHFRFEASNDRGSTHEFSLPHISVTHLREVENWPLVHATSGVELLTPQGRLSVMPANTKSLKLPGDAGLEMHLKCEKFLSQRSIGSLPEAERSNIVHDLFLGPLQEETSARRTHDPRHVYPLQSCRLYSVQSLPLTQLKQIHISRVFTALFPVPMAQIQSQVLLQENYQRYRLNGHQVFSITIENPHPFAIGFKMPTDFESALLLQPVVLFPPRRFLSSSKYLTVNLDIDWGQPANTWFHEGERIFELAPKTQIVIRAAMRTVAECHTNENNHSLLPAMVGFNYRFSKPFYLKRFFNWDPNSHDFSAATFDKNLTVAPSTDSGGVFDGWMPHRGVLVHSSSPHPRPPHDGFYAPDFLASIVAPNPLTSENICVCFTLGWVNMMTKIGEGI